MSNDSSFAVEKKEERRKKKEERGKRKDRFRLF
jgi:hypothetical protein